MASSTSAALASVASSGSLAARTTASLSHRASLAKSAFAAPAALQNSRRMSASARAETEPAAESSTATVTAEPKAAVATDIITAPPGFVAPEPQKFAVAPELIVDIALSAIGPLLRLGTGAFTTSYNAKVEPAGSAPSTQYTFGPLLGRELVETSTYAKRPEQPIILYEFEGCPFCRKVREAASAMDLDVLYYPCPQGGPNYRPEAIAAGGKKQFPYMVDPNTGVKMYESDDIIKYFADTYGDGTIPFMLRPGLVTNLTAGFASLARSLKGSRYTPAKKPSQPLELWAYEASPFCKVVREVLNELEIPHIYHSCARGSAKRSELLQRVGRFQVPYLEDPNTGVKAFESKAIIQYLKDTYTLPAES